MNINTIAWSIASFVLGAYAIGSTQKTIYIEKPVEVKQEKVIMTVDVDCKNFKFSNPDDWENPQMHAINQFCMEYQHAEEMASLQLAWENDPMGGVVLEPVK